MSNDATIPCPENLNPDQWEKMIANLTRSAFEGNTIVIAHQGQPAHILKALRLYAEHGGEIVERDQLRAVCEAFLARYQNQLVDARLMFGDIADQARAALDAAPEPRVKPWRNRYMTPEGVSQKEWDTTIRDMERLAADGDKMTLYALSRFRIFPEDVIARRWVYINDNPPIHIQITSAYPGQVQITSIGGGFTNFPIQGAKLVAESINDVVKEYGGRLDDRDQRKTSC